MGQLRTRYDGGTGPLPARLVDMAEQLFAELFAAEGAPVVLHGDLHHWNIAAAERQPWLALDPQGVTGEAAYEVGAWLRNPMDPAHPHLMDQPDVARIQARRLAQFAEILGFDRHRMAAWGVAQAVLSAWWTLDGHNEVDHATLACAEVLATLL
jgi:streptomycin 6-kinase